MKRWNMVNATLAAVTLAGLTLPAAAQYNGIYRPNVTYNSFPSPYIIQGYNGFWGNNGDWGGYGPNLFFGNNGMVALPNTYGFFRPPANYDEAEDLAENAPEPVPNNSVRSNVLPRTTDALQVEKDRNVISFAWNGDPDAVNRITFALLDRGKVPMRQRIITKLPATARLTRSSRTAYYRVTVEYVNGTTNSVIAPL